MGPGQEAAASRMVGGSATPAARRARLAAGRGGERTMKRLPSYSISVSVSKSRSATISGQEPTRPSAAMRSSNSVLSTRARKGQNTCPRMVSSSLWKIGRVVNITLASFRNSIPIAKEGHHGISFTSAVGPQIARHLQNLLGGRNLLGDVLDDAFQRDASAAARGVGHS